MVNLAGWTPEKPFIGQSEVRSREIKGGEKFSEICLRADGICPVHDWYMEYVEKYFIVEDII